jgi:hypothetical protein
MVMLMSEFDNRFTNKNEKSFLFEILRRVGRLESKGMLAATSDGWMVWEPEPSPSDGPGVGLARA